MLHFGIHILIRKHNFILIDFILIITTTKKINYNFQHKLMLFTLELILKNSHD